MTIDDTDRFTLRRQTDPQGFIDDLVAETTRQAKVIHDLTDQLAALRAELADGSVPQSGTLRSRLILRLLDEKPIAEPEGVVP